MTANTTNTSVVLNGTSVASEMAAKYNGFARKTAESVLQMAKVVYDMKAQKDKAEFEKFCNLIGFKSDSSYIRKFVQIGNKFDQLIGNASQLPSTWTTVYQIATLSNEAIDQFLEKGVINPTLSGAHAKQVLGLSKPAPVAVAANMNVVVPSGTENELSFVARFSGYPSAAVREKLKRIIAELKAIDFEVAASAGLDLVIAEPILALAA